MLFDVTILGKAEDINNIKMTAYEAKSDENKVYFNW